MNDKGIAIVGGAGFLGKRLAIFLKNKKIKHKIFDIDIENTSIDVSHIDISDPSTLNKLEGFSSIILLAAVHRDDIKPISKYDDVNVKGTENVCSAATKYGIEKIIFTSSVAIYGFAPKDTDENGAPNYFNDYGRTKYEAEKVLKTWFNEDPKKRTLNIIRPTVIFGEDNKGNVYNLLNQIALKRFIMFGNGKNIKSLAYVDNVAAFIKYSLSFEIGVHIYNYIDKPDLDMNKLVSLSRNVLFNKNNVGLRLPGFIGIFLGYVADIISFIIRRPIPVSSIRVKKFMSNTSFSSAIKNTGFRPIIDLESALIKTIKNEFNK